MAARVRQNKNIKGIKVFDGQDKDFKISQLADYTTLFLKTKQDTRKTLNLIEIYGSLSGLVLNRSKSQGIKLGNNKILIENDFEEIDWSSTSIKALGIFFGTNAEEIKNQNWDNKINKIENIISSWKSRHLTMIGRIQIANTLLIPRLTYLIKVLPITKDIIKKAEQLIYRFVWNSKYEKVKRKTLIRQYEQGGLKLRDLSLHITTMLSDLVPKLMETKTSQ